MLDVMKRQISLLNFDVLQLKLKTLMIMFDSATAWSLNPAVSLSDWQMTILAVLKPSGPCIGGIVVVVGIC